VYWWQGEGGEGGGVFSKKKRRLGIFLLITEKTQKIQTQKGMKKKVKIKSLSIVFHLKRKALCKLSTPNIYKRQF
jgi:hypothetical protein